MECVPMVGKQLRGSSEMPTQLSRASPLPCDQIGVCLLLAGMKKRVQIYLNNGFGPIFLRAFVLVCFVIRTKFEILTHEAISTFNEQRQGGVKNSNKRLCNQFSNDPYDLKKEIRTHTCKLDTTS